MNIQWESARHDQCNAGKIKAETTPEQEQYNPESEQ